MRSPFFALDSMLLFLGFQEESKRTTEEFLHRNEAQIDSARPNPNTQEVREEKGPTGGPHTAHEASNPIRKKISRFPLARTLSHAPAWRRSRGGIHHHHQQPHRPLGPPLLPPARSLAGGSRDGPRLWSPRARSAARTSTASCGARGRAPTPGPSAWPSRQGRPRSVWTAGSPSPGGSRRPPVPPARAP